MKAKQLQLQLQCDVTAASLAANRSRNEPNCFFQEHSFVPWYANVVHLVVLVD